jgi:tritrans,polycis-undecaprenyl-diphosphate synthase [geranylgeranyl-diphosphate specific]
MLKSKSQVDTSILGELLTNPTFNKMHNWLTQKAFFNSIRDFYREARAYRILGRVKQRRVPAHIAIIMDGNRRWAKKMGVDINVGHEVGRDTLEMVFDWCLDIGAKVLTVYAFSTENLKRSKEEVDFLMSKFAEELTRLIDEPRIHKFNCRVKILGDISLLSPEVRGAAKRLEEKTKDYNGFFFNLAIGYGGREEIIHGIEKIAEDVKDGKIQIEDISEETFSKYLYTADLPDPDLIIRTSGEERISNFLLWQAAYSELYFADVYWPEFNKRQFMKAIEDYQLRQRRYGK